jgi:RNA polymerase sigma-70 factor (ECF subfamily)
MQAQSEHLSAQSTALSDCELLVHFRHGDRSAFAELVRRWESALGRIAYRVTGDAATAEDVRQTVFLRLLESHDGMRRPDQVAAWLRRCAVNVAITELRRRKVHQRAGARLEQDCSDRVGGQPDDAMAADEEAAQLGKALATLEPDQRALLSLRFDEELTFREIAATVERPVSTVKSQIGTAITRLRALLNPSGKGAT